MRNALTGLVAASFLFHASVGARVPIGSAPHWINLKSKQFPHYEYEDTGVYTKNGLTYALARDLEGESAAGKDYRFVVYAMDCAKGRSWMAMYGVMPATGDRPDGGELNAVTEARTQTVDGLDVSKLDYLTALHAGICKGKGKKTLRK